ncbi:hypothetical protein PVAND_001053 [Polypedilum vanderplanki]|uniref:C2HC/C3H-type domain-containing protein n=1 Tax=Polypedilum vanderplanki TaxID=319348 RepID=A0A9J6BMD6_POLVA|nr:hypothetical protein PVAND_001053 [Polypedilum vanderplanki]
MSSQGSRLTQIQMRYQQKVMQENAQKKSDMYALDDTQKLLTSSLGAGKVRAMFDERRNRITAGIDKSYLLEPLVVETKTTKITTTTKQQQHQRQSVGSKSTRDQKMNYTKVIVPPLQNRYINNNHDINGNNHFTANEDIHERTTLRSNDTALVNTKPTIRTKSLGTANGNGVTKKASPTNTSSSTSAPLKNVTNQKPSPSRSMKSGNSTSSTNSIRSTVTNGSGSTKVSATAPSVRSKTISAASTKSFENSPQNSFDEIDDAPVPEGLIRCDICKRNFAEDRIEKHRVICQKTKAKKRKIYDASKKRVQGTEAESYNRKPLSARATKQPTSTPTSSKGSNWRAKHEDFIKTIRAAKEMQAYVAKGGKLSDLPPPPPSENPDYVQCPNCSRRFNEAAASRHIPICQNINKPKPKAGGLTTKANSIAKRR